MRKVPDGWKFRVDYRDENYVIILLEKGKTSLEEWASIRQRTSNYVYSDCTEEELRERISNAVSLLAGRANLIDSVQSIITELTEVDIYA